MANLVDLANDALAAIGAAGSTNVPFIASLDDARNEAVVCKRFLAPTDKSMSLMATILEFHDWNCARGRAELAAQATAPIFGFSYSYVLPPDYLKVRRINGSETVIYKVEGTAILTNEVSPIFLEYTRFEIDPNKWSPGVKECMSLLLQSKLAVPLKSDRDLANDLRDALWGNRGKGIEGAIFHAASVDGVEGSQETQTTPDLLEVRG